MKKYQIKVKLDKKNSTHSPVLPDHLVQPNKVIDSPEAECACVRSMKNTPRKYTSL